MSVTFELPANLERQLQHDLGDLSQAAKEALLIQAYRTGKLSVGALAKALGLSVVGADTWLAERGVPLNYTMEHFEADRQALAQALDKKL